jgi:hypothetical protein
MHRDRRHTTNQKVSNRTRMGTPLHPLSSRAANSVERVKREMTKPSLPATTNQEVKSKGAPACPGVPWGLASETWDPSNLFRRAVDRSLLETQPSPLSSRLPRPAVGAADLPGQVKGGMNMGKRCLQSRPRGPAPKISPARKGWVHRQAIEHRRCGTTLFGCSSGAKPWRDLQFHSTPNQRSRHQFFLVSTHQQNTGKTYAT